MVIVFIGALFPILINTYEGVRNADKVLINVVRSFGASEWDIARLVVVPNALPYIVAGLRLAIGRAVLGVVVAEFFGSEDGLGVIMVQAAGRYQVDVVFAGLIVFAALSLVMTGMVQAHRRPPRPLAAAARSRTAASGPQKCAPRSAAIRSDLRRDVIHLLEGGLEQRARSRNCSGSGSGLSFGHWFAAIMVETARFEDFAEQVLGQLGAERVVQLVPDQTGELLSLSMPRCSLSAVIEPALLSRKYITALAMARMNFFTVSGFSSAKALGDQNVPPARGM